MISNYWFSVLINGDSVGFFKSSRGIRQGDPIAPALFIIAEESLSRSLHAAFSKGDMDWFAGPRGCPTISHLLFADDTLIFTKASARSIKNLLSLLNTYEQASGQLISIGKSGYFLHPNVKDSVAQKNYDLTGYSTHTFPHKYLGFPLISGRKKKVHFTSILASV